MTDAEFEQRECVHPLRGQLSHRTGCIPASDGAVSFCGDLSVQPCDESIPSPDTGVVSGDDLCSRHRPFNNPFGVELDACDSPTGGASIEIRRAPRHAQPIGCAIDDVTAVSPFQPTCLIPASTSCSSRQLKGANLF